MEGDIVIASLHFDLSRMGIPTRVGEGEKFVATNADDQRPSPKKQRTRRSVGVAVTGSAAALLHFSRQRKSVPTIAATESALLMK